VDCLGDGGWSRMSSSSLHFRHGPVDNALWCPRRCINQSVQRPTVEHQMLRRVLRDGTSMLTDQQRRVVVLRFGAMQPSRFPLPLAFGTTVRARRAQVAFSYSQSSEQQDPKLFFGVYITSRTDDDWSLRRWRRDAMAASSRKVERGMPKIGNMQRVQDNCD
jgi:hypothetical protein